MAASLSLTSEDTDTVDLLDLGASMGLSIGSAIASMTLSNISLNVAVVLTNSGPSVLLSNLPEDS